MNKKLWIAAGIALLVVALVCVVVLATAPMREEARARNYYVNQIYCLLVDLAKELETCDPAEPSLTLQNLVVALDTTCEDVTLTSDSKWFIFDSCFTSLESNIDPWVYQKSDLEQMAADLREMLQQLSDRTGTQPRRNVSYDELGMLLVCFLTEWDRSFTLW